MKVALTTVGLAFDVAGVVLVALPEIAPRARHVARTGRAGRTDVAQDARAARPSPRRDHHDRPGRLGRTAGSFSLSLGVPDDASDERKLAFLLSEAKRTQERLGNVERDLANQPAERAAELQSLRDDLESLFRTAIEEKGDVYIKWRLIGLGCLLVGSSLLATANLV